MKDKEKTKKQLIQELAEMHQRIIELEALESNHKQIEEALESERRRLFSVLDELPAFVYLQSPDYSIRFANRYFREHFGEPEGRTCYEILWGKKEPCEPCLTFCVFDTKSPQEWEWTQPGTGHVYQIYDYPFIDIDGSPLVLEMGFDITERKRAEERIDGLNRLKEELLRPGGLDERLKRITDGVVQIFDADFARIWITQPGDLCDSGCFHARVTEGPHVCRHRDRCLYLIASSGRYIHIDGEVHRRVPFGCYKIGRVAAGEDPKFITNDAIHDPRVHDHDWVRKLGLVSFAGYRLLSVTEEPIGVLALFSKHVISSEEDALLEGLANTTSQVIQRTRAEEALAEERNLLRTLIDNLPDYIYFKDTESRFIISNSAVAHNMGATRPDELIGKTDFDFYPQELAVQYYTDEREVIQSGQPLVNRVEPIIDPSGNRIWFLTTKVPLRDSQGKIVGLVGIGRDITERKRVEEILKTRARQQATVAELGQKALINIDLSMLMNEAVVLVSQTLNVEYCKVMKLLPDKDALLLLAGIGWKEGLVGRATVGVGTDSQAGYTLLSHKPVIVEDLRTETRFSRPPLLREHGVVSGISVIIGDRKQPFGILEAHTTRHRIFTQDDIHFLQNIANVLATMVERKQVEEALRENEERFRSIVQNGEVGYFYIDREGRFQEVNDAWLRMHKYTSRDEVIGQHFAVTQVDRDLERAQKIVNQLFHGAPIPKGEFTRRCKDGSIEYHMFSAIPVKKGGNIIGLEGFLMDATERKRAEEALKKSEERYRLLLGSISDGVYALNREWRYTLVNDVAARLMQMRQENLLGKKIIDLSPGIEETEFFKGYQRVMETREPEVIATEYTFEDGRKGWYEVRVYPVPEGILCIAVDITERKRAEEQLQHYAVELQEANEELSQYAYVVSHDLKAPLRAIRNYADFLREDLEATLDEEQRTYLEGLNRAVQEANALIEDLLELSQIGQREIEVETLEVGSFLRALFPSLDLPANVEIIMEDDWPMLTTEPVLLRQIFQNLISNAVKFNTSPQKQIELGWQQVGEEHYEFFVRDNGIGFDLRHQEKIFRVFERLHTREEFDGTGIGLAIVKKAVGKMGGSIQVESKPGEGSTFFVILPRTITNSTTNWE